MKNKEKKPTIPQLPPTFELFLRRIIMHTLGLHIYCHMADAQIGKLGANSWSFLATRTIVR